MASIDDRAATASWYRRAGERDLVGHSALHVEWALGAAGDDEVVALIARLPREHRQPSLLFSAAAMVGAPAAGWPVLREWLLAHWVDVAAIAAERLVQTNEVQRSAPLAAALAGVDGPVALLELGASAGLCLLPDRWGLDFVHDDGRASSIGPDGLRLTCRLSGVGRMPTRLPSIVWRRGIDLAPRSASDADDRRWLEACVPPDRPDRLARLRSALAEAAVDPPSVVAGDGLAAIEAQSAEAPADVTLVVVSLGTLVFLPPSARAGFGALVDALGARSITLEGVAALPDVVERATGLVSPRPTPFLLARDGIPLAHATAHGDAISWLS